MPSIQKKMGLLPVISMVIGLQVGTALFLTPTQLASYGLWGILSWLITGTGAISLSLIFAKLSEKNTSMGGPSVFIKDAFGKKTAFCIGWTYWVISWVSSLTVLAVAVSNLEHAFGALDFWPKVFLEVGLLGFLTILNLRGVVFSGIAETIFAVLKVVPWTIIPLLCLSYWQKNLITIPTNITPLQALNSASLITFWGFVGVEGATTLVNCAHNPKRTVPLALVLGTTLVALIYLLNTVVLMGTIPGAELAQTSSPYGLLLEKILGSWAGRSCSFLIGVMCLGTLNSWILASGQIAFLSAKQGLFPSAFIKENPQGSPAFSIKTTALLLILGHLLTKNPWIESTLTSLINFSSALFVVVYMACALALIKFLRTKALPSGVGIWIMTVLGMVFCLWSLITASMTAWLCGILIPLSGFLMAKILKWPVLDE